MGNQQPYNPGFMSDKAFKVVIEYCTSWGYYNKALMLKDTLKEAFPNCTVDCVVCPTKGGYEVKVTPSSGKETLVHSKLKGEGMPDKEKTEKMLNKIKEII
jgi:selT/selW/selH-like putative selenoprotein